MNTDRDLLEMAAKAAGLRVICHASYPQGGVYVDDMEDDWNPITDDGDALRLAVQKSIFLEHHKLFLKFINEEFAMNNRPTEATRRAIVRAAAEIGKEMK